MEFNVGDHVRYVGGGRVFRESFMGKTGRVTEILSRAGAEQKVSVSWDDWDGRWIEESSAWPYSQNLEPVGS